MRILFGAAFIGNYPVAATDLNLVETASKETGKSPISEKKNNRTGIYIYDENLGVGYIWGVKIWKMIWN